MASEVPMIPILFSGLALLAAPAGPNAAPLFTSRVAYAPLEEKLRTAGQSFGQIIHPRSVADLEALAPGKRYKFVVLADGSLAIAPLPADARHNEYVHPILAGGGPVRTAGGIRVERSGKRLARVVVDQDSQAYCPTRASLAAAVDALSGIGVPRGVVSIEDRPPRCTSAM
jgi:hypothetical protein